MQHQRKAEKNYVRALIRQSKTKHYHNQFNACKGNTAATWKVIRGIVPGKNEKFINHNFENTKEKAEEFHNFFANVVKNTFEKTQHNLHNQIIRPPPRSNENEYFRPQPGDTNTVILAVKSFKETNSYGCDEISFRFIKDTLFVIIFYLTCIINTSIITGIFPGKWKHALVVPFFKTGDINNVSNFRPISVLPTLSKILEKIVANQRLHFLETKKLLSKCQHGFRSRLSTETNLTVITDAIYNNMDHKKISLLTLCDLSKAFDSVSHDILINKCARVKK